MSTGAQSGRMPTGAEFPRGPTSADFAQIHTDTTSPEVAKLLIAHTIAVRVATDGATGRPDADTYLEVFDKVYKGIAATTAGNITVA